MQLAYSKRPNTDRIAYSGFSLVEVLITLLIISLGLVGLAALQLTAIKNVHSSLLTTTATAAALDFEERAWLALASLESGCVDASTLDMDLVSDWSIQTSGIGLPGFEIATTGTDTAGWRDYELTLSWLEGRFEDVAVQTGDSAGRESFTFHVRVPCK